MINFSLNIPDKSKSKGVMFPLVSANAHLPFWAKIDGYPDSYNHTHDLAWGLIYLESCVDWTGKEYASGYFGPLAENTIVQIAKNDAIVLDCMEKAIAILEGEQE